jgi:zinc transport system substrate-binding protein
MRRTALLAIVVALLPVPARAAPPRVVATLTPLAFVAEALGAGRATTHVLVPPGASPHLFQPRPGDVRRLAGADLLLSAGGGIDDWLDPLLAAAPPRGAWIRLDALPGAGAENDPHRWLDPLFVRDAVAPAVTAALVRADPAGGDRYRAALEAFQGRLSALDDEIRGRLADVPTRRFVAFHPAWRTFAARYGLEEIAVVQDFAAEEPTPRRIAHLVDAARATGTRALLLEPQLDPRVAEAIAGEFDGRTLLVDPLGDPRDPQRSSYEALLRFDARAFRWALGGVGG